MKDESRFWDRIADKYYRRPIDDPESYQEKLRRTQQLFHPDMQVLEFGCGTGGTAVAHAPHVKEYRALDVSDKMLDYGRAQATSAGVTNLSFERGSIEAFDAEPNSFDVILGMSILHLLEDRDAVLEKVRRLLKPGGIFISSTACIADKAKVFRYIAPIGRALGFFPLVKVFGEAELITALREAGFTVEQQWRPEKAMAVFVIASKPAEPAAASTEKSDLINSQPPVHIDNASTLHSSIA